SIVLAGWSPATQASVYLSWYSRVAGAGKAPCPDRLSAANCQSRRKERKTNPSLGVSGWPNHKGDHDESSDTRRNRFSRDVVARFWGGGHVTNESARQRAECGACPRGLGGRVRMGRRLQGAEEERLCRDDRSGGDHVAR